jgi:hypothetical protein
LGAAHKFLILHPKLRRMPSESNFKSALAKPTPGSGYSPFRMLIVDGWNAGAALMEAQSPGAWRTLMDAGKLSTANAETLGACRDAASKAKKEQRCAVVVPAP